MEMEIKIKIKLDKGLKIPNCNDMGEIEEGFWSQQDIENHFKSGLVHMIRSKVRSVIRSRDYIDDLNFEGVETVSELEEKFGFGILIDGKPLKLN